MPFRPAFTAYAVSLRTVFCLEYLVTLLRFSAVYLAIVHNGTSLQDLPSAVTTLVICGARLMAVTKCAEAITQACWHAVYLVISVGLEGPHLEMICDNSLQAHQRQPESLRAMQPDYIVSQFKQKLLNPSIPSVGFCRNHTIPSQIMATFSTHQQHMSLWFLGFHVAPLRLVGCGKHSHSHSHSSGSAVR